MFSLNELGRGDFFQSNFTLVMASFLAMVALSASGCSSGGSSAREAVQQDTQAYRCAGFDPVADEIDYPADVERASKRLQTTPACRSGAGASARRPEASRQE
jgi:hypothetical protein